MSQGCIGWWEELSYELNEVYLWHGTKEEHVDSIITTGFNERCCNLKGFYGAGIYFGTLLPFES